ncbi:hypothetical protein DFH07DRAFT_1034820 [Mycena maculata]|uniref:Uncharacterized protein n=1 Tax=Mycena maculata TaxID=230809 RepID=A0AAD7IUS2_9AGAR|nr:hypothetical protein DFH07DRAFT_1034820 [Mycena maculata]
MARHFSRRRRSDLWTRSMRAISHGGNPYSAGYLAFTDSLAKVLHGVRFHDQNARDVQLREDVSTKGRALVMRRLQEEVAEMWICWERAEQFLEEQEIDSLQECRTTQRRSPKAAKASAKAVKGATGRLQTDVCHPNYVMGDVWMWSRSTPHQRHVGVPKSTRVRCRWRRHNNWRKGDARIAKVIKGATRGIHYDRLLGGCRVGWSWRRLVRSQGSEGGVKGQKSRKSHRGDDSKPLSRVLVGSRAGEGSYEIGEGLRTERFATKGEDDYKPLSSTLEGSRAGEGDEMGEGPQTALEGGIESGVQRADLQHDGLGGRRAQERGKRFGDEFRADGGVGLGETHLATGTRLPDALGANYYDLECVHRV